MGKKRDSSAIMMREVDKLGRVVIPKEYRDTLGWEEKDPIAVEPMNDGVFLHKYKPGCLCGCNDPDELISYRGRLYCRACIKTMSKMVQALEADD